PPARRPGRTADRQSLRHAPTARRRRRYASEARQADGPALAGRERRAEQSSIQHLSGPKSPGRSSGRGDSDGARTRLSPDRQRPANRRRWERRLVQSIRAVRIFVLVFLLVLGFACDRTPAPPLPPPVRLTEAEKAEVKQLADAARSRSALLDKKRNAA